jgi:hypothetical protein
MEPDWATEDTDDDDWEREFDEDEDEWEQAAEECGLLPPHLGGFCQLSGTEHCDFECPFRDNPEWLTGDAPSSYP